MLRAQKFFPLENWAALKPLLSLCLIVKNEMENLPACLESVKGLADEIIVVDTGSTDGTVPWAEKWGAKVTSMEWTQDFSAARNRSLSLAKGSWILWMDADDRLLIQDRKAIRSLVELHAQGQKGPSAYGFSIKNSSDGGVTGTVFNQIRLFPNRPDLRFTSPIHEQILPAIETAGIPVEYLPIQIIHTGYANGDLALKKQERNRLLLTRQIRENNHVTAVTYYTLAMACLDLGDPQSALQHLDTAKSKAMETQTNPHIIRIVPIKKAVALAKQAHFFEALEMLEREQSEGIPEACLVRAQILNSMGREEEARLWFEKLLGYTTQLSFIPLDLPLAKIEALQFLGDYWHKRGSGKLAIDLLKAGLALKRGGDFSAPDLIILYAKSNTKALMPFMA